MPKYNVNTKLLYKPLSLPVAWSNRFYVTKILLNKRWEDGKATDQVESVTYDVVDDVNFEHFRFKIPGQTTPIITNEELRELRNDGKRVMATFTNPTVTLYVNEKKELLTDSFKAEDIELLDGTEV